MLHPVSPKKTKMGMVAWFWDRVDKYGTLSTFPGMKGWEQVVFCKCLSNVSSTPLNVLGCVFTFWLWVSSTVHWLGPYAIIGGIIFFFERLIADNELGKAAGARRKQKRFGTN
jgi:hypothetical protein